MFLFNFNKFKTDPFFYLLLLFCMLLPFQFALNPTPEIDLAIVRVLIPLLFLGWFFWSLKIKKPLVLFNLATVFFILYLFLAVFSCFFAHNLSWSLRKLAFLFSFAPLFFITVSTLKTSQKQRALFFVLVSSATALSFVAILQFTSQFIFGIDPVYHFLTNQIAPFFLGQTFAKTVQAYPSWLVNADGITYMRATAMFPDPHMLAYFFGLLIPWALALWATTTKKYTTWFAFMAFLLILADMFTFTRGSYIALISGGIIILPLVSKKTASKIILGIGLFACLFMIVPRNPVGAVGARLVSSFDAHEGSNQARLSNWQQALLIIRTNPLGVGIGNYSLAVNPDATYREPIYAHNMYLDIAAELGIPAMLIFIGLLFLSFKSYWLKAKNNSFYIAGVASITIFAVHSLVENPLYSVHVFPLFLVILAVAFINQVDEKKSHN